MKAKRQTTKHEPPGKMLRYCYRARLREFFANADAAPRRQVRTLDNLLTEITRRDLGPSGYIYVGNVPLVAESIEHTAKKDPDRARKTEEQWILLLMLTRMHRFARNNPRAAVIRRNFPKLAKALRGRK